LAEPAALATAAHILKNSTEIIGSIPSQTETYWGNLRNLIIVDHLLDIKFLRYKRLTQSYPSIYIVGLWRFLPASSRTVGSTLSTG
jgi:hypothetical protein